MPYGKLPVLEVDGKRVCQSTAICRYLGKENNLAGKNNWESLQIDSLIDSMHDFRIGMFLMLYNHNKNN
jgi:glutathione S-transferase